MAMNPMQRKANNAFLLGILVTLVIAGAIIALLFIRMTKIQEELTQKNANMTSIVVLKKDVKSGEEIYLEDFEEVSVDSSVIPSNAITKKWIDENSNYFNSREKKKNAENNANNGNNASTENNANNEKKEDKKIVAKIELAKSTIVEPSMIVREGNQVTDDLRKQEYGCIVTPTQIKTGEFIDVRLRLPNGMDFVVATKKEVTIPQIGGADSENLIHINLKEDEILSMSCAIVESYMMKGSYLYATTYIEPGMQKALIPTYIPSSEVTNLIAMNPNIVDEAKMAIVNRHESPKTGTFRKDSINNQIGATDPDERKSLVEQGVQKEAETIKNERAKYLNALATQAPATTTTTTTTSAGNTN